MQRTRRENEDLENRLDRMQSALEMLEGVLDELSVEPQLRQSMSKKGLAGLRQSKQNITELIRESKVMKAALRASQIISLPPPVEMDEQGTGDTGAPVSSDQVILA